MTLYNFTEAVSLANSLFTNKYGEHTTSVASVLKPLNIGSVSFISNSHPLLLKKKVQEQLSKVLQLEKKLRFQMYNSQYEQIKKKNEIDMEYVSRAHVIHQQYFSKVLFLKSKYRRVNSNALGTILHIYEKQLFMLNQQYQKQKIQMSPYSSKNEDMDNNTPAADNGNTTETLT